MSLPRAINDRLVRTFALYRDLSEGFDDATLHLSLPGIPCNTIGQQLWCVVGARESYARAIRNGAWAGFACSLQTIKQAKMSAALASSAAAVIESLATLPPGDWDEARSGLVLDLMEHEASHQGQLIRYLYGLGLTIPPSWKTRYALD